MSFQKNKSSIVILILLIIGSFLRFYDLSWGEPYFFHPDERNIALAVSQMTFPTNLNPHFFAYGGLPIYVIFLSGIFINFMQSIFGQGNFINRLGFEEAIMLSRFYSAFLSLLLIPLLYLTGRKLKDENTGLLAATLGTMSVGFIQFAHFGTFEIWLTFFTLLLFWICINFKFSVKYFIITGLIIGLLVSIKISSIVLLPLPLLPTLMFSYNYLRKKHGGLIRHLSKIFLYFVLFLIAGITTYIITNPYAILDFKSFRGSIEYESRVGLGTLPVFYTGEFIGSIPILYQIRYVLPFLLNPVVLILFIPLLIYFISILIKEKKISYFVLLFFFLFTFLTQVFLFVKWVRYIVPSLPFIILIISVATFSISKSVKKIRYFRYALISVLILSCAIYSISYFITAYIERDSRLEALTFAKSNIPLTSRILSEVFDMGIVPFNESFLNISLFNFYDLDNTSIEYTEESLKMAIESREYIILPSQRIYSVRLSKKDMFPLGNAFYRKLMSGELGYIKIYETPCSIFCKIAYFNNPSYSYEQTANVFDKPNILIFKKK